MLNIRSPDEVAIELAHRIKKLRLIQKWSRNELAERAGINTHTLKHFELTGQISLKRFLALCFVLDTITEFDNILQPPEPRTIDEIKQARKPRQRGRRWSKKYQQ